MSQSESDDPVLTVKLVLFNFLFKSILGRCVVRSHYESVKASWCVGLIDIGDIGIPFSTQNAPA